MYGIKALPQASYEHCRGRVVTKALFHLSEDRLFIFMARFMAVPITKVWLKVQGNPSCQRIGYSGDDRPSHCAGGSDHEAH